MFVPTRGFPIQMMSPADMMQLAADTKRRIAEFRAQHATAPSAAAPPAKSRGTTLPHRAPLHAKPSASVPAKRSRRPPPARTDGPTAEHVIYGSIEDNTEATLDFLDGCVRVGVQTATLRIVDSCGGRVEDALAIRRALVQARRNGVHVTCLLEGRCYSAAALVAGACSYIIAHASATWLIHDANATETGCAVAHDRAARMLRQTNAALAARFAEDSGLPRGRIAVLMIMGRVMGAREAARLGFINKIVEHEP